MFSALRGGNVKAGNVKVELKGKACQRCIDNYALVCVRSHHPQVAGVLPGRDAWLAIHAAFHAYGVVCNVNYIVKRKWVKEKSYTSALSTSHQLAVPTVDCRRV